MKNGTLIDSIFHIFGWNAPAHAKQDKQINQEEIRGIPWSYPIIGEIPIYPPKELLVFNLDILKTLGQLVRDDEILFLHYEPVVKRLATFVHLIPASQIHHHRGLGGLLRHSLEVGIGGMRLAQGKVNRNIGSSNQRRNYEQRWLLAIFIAGICHDLGKAVTNLTVTDEEKLHVWIPFLGGIYGWAQDNNIKNYIIHWKEDKKHIYTSSMLSSAVIPDKTMSWLSKEDECCTWLFEFINGNQGNADDIYNLVMRADQLSIDGYMKLMGDAMVSVRYDNNDSCRVRV